MFENLQSGLDRAIRNLKGQGRITELNVAETLKEVRRVLLDSDVNYQVASEFISRVREQAMGQKILINVEPGQLLVKIVYDELTRLMGGESQDVRQAKNPPTLVLVSGLQGSGKTTFCGKLARRYKSKGMNPLLIACDVYRPAAITQLSVLGQQTGVEVYKEEANKNPLAIAQAGIAYAKQRGKDFVIIDTAGRLAVDEEMMLEISLLKKSLQPTETLFVVDSMTGQDAVNTAKAFNERLNFDGVVLTKLDGDTRGGAAISIRSVVEKPIKYVSTGEKMEDLDLFYPDRMASRILGMGDVLTLVEKAQQQFDEKQARDLQNKIRKNELDLQDFLSQIQGMRKIANVKDLVAMIPGMGKMMKGAEINEDSFRHLEAIILSMTPEERRKPDVINGNRRKRIALGSGRPVHEVNELLKQFQELKKAMKKMTQMGGKMPRGMAGGLPGMRRR